MTEKITVGSLVTVKRHWARGMQVGKVVEIDTDGVNNYKVEFEKPGIGLDNKYLWLSVFDLTINE